MELYSYSKYRGYRLFVECVPLGDDETLYEGVAQHNGTTIFISNSLIGGDLAVLGRLRWIGEEM